MRLITAHRILIGAAIAFFAFFALVSLLVHDGLDLGQAYLGQGIKDKAREAFQKAKELNPGLNVPSINP